MCEADPFPQEVPLAYSQVSGLVLLIRVAPLHSMTVKKTFQLENSRKMGEVFTLYSRCVHGA